MPFADRVPMGPGPSNPYPEAMAAFSRPLLGKGDALLIVDCVTSLGGIPVEVDAWGIDIAYAGTQKCLGVPPGLAPITVSDRARQRLVERCPSWYLDFGMIADYVETGSARRYHLGGDEVGLGDRHHRHTHPGIEVGGGIGAYAGKVWRIGCMGHTARPRNVTLLLGALAEVITA